MALVIDPKFLPLMGTSIYLIYVLIVIFTISFFTEKVFSHLYKNLDKIEVRSLPYTCNFSNLVGIKILTDFTLVFIFSFFIPSLLIVGLKLFTPDYFQDVSVLSFSAYCVGFWLIILFFLSFCFFVKKGPSIEITDQYIDFRWQRVKEIDIYGKIYYSTISEFRIDEDVMLIVIEDQEFEIPLKVIICYKGYNKIIDMLQRREL